MVTVVVIPCQVPTFANVSLLTGTSYIIKPDRSIGIITKLRIADWDTTCTEVKLENLKTNLRDNKVP